MALTIVKGACYKITGTTTSSAEITSGLTFVRSVLYIPSDAAHLVNLIDADGGPIINLVGDSTGDSSPNTQQWDVGQSFFGIYSDDFDGGTLYIYTR